MHTSKNKTRFLNATIHHDKKSGMISVIDVIRMAIGESDHICIQLLYVMENNDQTIADAMHSVLFDDVLTHALDLRNMVRLIMLMFGYLPMKTRVECAQVLCCKIGADISIIDMVQQELIDSGYSFGKQNQNFHYSNKSDESVPKLDIDDWEWLASKHPTHDLFLREEQIKKDRKALNRREIEVCAHERQRNAMEQHAIERAHDMYLRTRAVLQAEKDLIVRKNALLMREQELIDFAKNTCTL